MANEPSVAINRADDISAVVVDSIAVAIAPENVPVGRQFDVLSNVQIERRMNVIEVGGADERDFAEIRAAREQRIERAEVAVVRIVVAADDIRAQSKPRHAEDIGEGVAGIGGQRPCADVAAAECTELINALKVVIPRAGLAKESCPE